MFNDSINDIFIVDDDDAYEDVIFFNYYQACDIQAAELKKLSEAYNVDFRNLRMRNGEAIRKRYRNNQRKNPQKRLYRI